MRPALRRAYRRTSYVAGDAEVRIGRRCPAMDALLSSRGVREAAFLTAYNPFSRKMPLGWNRRMQDRLSDMVRRKAAISATGRWRRWSEAHILVFIGAGPALKLARRFRQNAIVIVRLKQLAHLLIIL